MNSSENSAQLLSRLELAKIITRRAGDITLRYFRTTELTIDRKQDATPVTVADRESEKYLRAEILTKFQDDSVLGEEYGEQPGTSDFQWVLDPIDGTKSFIHGIPLYGVLVGILENGVSKAGVIYIPATSEMVYAMKGQGAWYVERDAEPVPARVSRTTKLSEALFLTSEVKTYRTERKKDATSVYINLQEEALLARTWGDAYGYLMVATGRADIELDPAMNIWDAAPMLPIIEEAGGEFTNWKGEATVTGGDAIATNGLLHATVLERLREFTE